MKISIKGTGDIYLVDDDEIFHFIFKKFLAANPALKNEVTSFFDAESCLDRLIEIKDEPSDYPAVVFMDINMPTMNGFECVQKIRSMDTFTYQPIIMMLSSSNSATDVKRAIDCGATDYIEKPANMNDLVFVNE